MALALWAKTAAGPNLAFVKGFKAIKSWKDILQQTFFRKVAPKHKADATNARDRCIFQPVVQIRPAERLQSRVFRSLFTRWTNNSMASALRRKSAVFSSRAGHFRSGPIVSLIGVTLGMDVSQLIEGNSEKVMSNMRDMFQDYGWHAEPLDHTPHSLEDLDIIHNSIANGCEGAVYKAKVKTQKNVVASNDEDFDLAVKAVFNYGAESNAGSILNELRREVVPLNARTCGNQDDDMISPDIGCLPAHPNIVDMPGIFVDDMLVTEDGLKNFPAAMPQRLNTEQCYGRNKTLYLVMRRRSTHLRDYLANQDVSMATRCLILAQVLEGISHLVQHGVAHRDLKTDNILVDVPKAGGPPKVEICDFGCCLAEDDKNLQVDFPSRELFIGGNCWLMAPEIVTATPGPNRVLDFSRTDAWAVGTLAYEILGAENPFYPSKDNSRRQLRSRDYREEELPSLPETAPPAVQKLVFALLSRDPRKRPSASVAATVMHLVAMEFEKSLNRSRLDRNVEQRKTGHHKPQLAHVIKEREMFQGVLVQGLSLLCQLTFSSEKSCARDVQSLMRFLFLSRLSYKDFRAALYYF